MRAAARRRRRPGSRIVHPGKGIELLEEKHEGRDQQALGEAFAAQLHHKRGQDRGAGQAAAHEPLQGVRRIIDNGSACCDRGLLRRLGGAVRALVVDNHDSETAWVDLRQQRSDGGSHNLGLVACRNDSATVGSGALRLSATRASSRSTVRQKPPRKAIR